MVRKSILSRCGKSSAAVEEVVEKARCEEGVDRILVVYEGDDARVYVEKEKRPRKASAPTSGNR